MKIPSLGDKQTLFYNDRFLLNPAVSQFELKKFFDEEAGVFRVSSPDSTHSVVAYVNSQVFDDDKGVKCVGVSFGKDPCYNVSTIIPLVPEPSFEDREARWLCCKVDRPTRRLEVKWWGDRWEERAGALEAKATLNSFLYLKEKFAELAAITHIIICGIRKGFLRDMHEWKWVYKDDWTLTKQNGTDREDAPNEVKSLLGKLVDLRQEQPPIRVSFALARAKDVVEAGRLAEEHGTQHTRTKAVTARVRREILPEVYGK